LQTGSSATTSEASSSIDNKQPKIEELKKKLEQAKKQLEQSSSSIDNNQSKVEELKKQLERDLESTIDSFIVRAVVAHLPSTTLAFRLNDAQVKYMSEKGKVAVIRDGTENIVQVVQGILQS